MATPTVSYFAYGSNCDPERFRARVGDWITRRPAVLPGHCLRFADSVRSEGGGGAVFDAAPGETLYGVLFEISPEQLAAMDREEFDPARNVTQAGRRLQMRVQVEGEDGGVMAELYNVRDDGGRCAPSARYLEHILVGLEDAGHSMSVLAAVRAAAAQR